MGGLEPSFPNTLEPLSTGESVEAHTSGLPGQLQLWEGGLVEERAQGHDQMQAAVVY